MQRHKVIQTGNRSQIIENKEIMDYVQFPTLAPALPQPGQPANDELYAELEARYGSGFAQWLADSMNTPSK